MAFKRIILVFGIFMAGCDPILEPPVIMNEFSTNIEIRTNFEDGTANQIVLLPCQTFDTAELDLASVEFSSVLVSKEGAVIHYIDKQELSLFMDQQKANADSSIWSISSNGIHLHPEGSTACAKS